MNYSREQIERLRLRGETGKAKRAFLDYLALGPQRSLATLIEKYRDPEIYVQDDPRSPQAPPTRQLHTLKAWSSAHDWNKRSGRVSDEQAEIILREQARSLAEAMQSKYARVSERIEVLNEVAEMLVSHIRSQGIVATKVRIIRGKAHEESTVDTASILALRGVLEDLAAETGGRARNIQHRLPDGPLSKNRTIFVLPPVEDRAPGPRVVEGSFSEP